MACSLPMLDSYLFKEGKILNENHIEVTCDPYDLRNGYSTALKYSRDTRHLL